MNNIEELRKYLEYCKKRLYDVSKIDRIEYDKRKYKLSASDRAIKELYKSEDDIVTHK